MLKKEDIKRLQSNLTGLQVRISSSLTPRCQMQVLRAVHHNDVMQFVELGGLEMDLNFEVDD